MARYIDAEQARTFFEEIDAGSRAHTTLLTPYEFAEYLDEIPTADVQEVKHAKNLQNCFKWTFECSLCHWCDDDTYCCDSSEFNFCPNCGAKMDNNDFYSRGERRKEDVDA